VVEEEQLQEERRREEPVQRMATMARRSRSMREVPTGVLEELDSFIKISEEDHRIRPMARLRLLSTTTATETAMIDTMDREALPRIPCRDLQTMVHLQAPGMAILKVKDRLSSTVRTTMVTETDRRTMTSPREADLPRQTDGALPRKTSLSRPAKSSSG